MCPSRWRAGREWAHFTVGREGGREEEAVAELSRKMETFPCLILFVGGCIIHFSNSFLLLLLILFPFSGENGWNLLSSLSQSRRFTHAKIPPYPRHRYPSWSRGGRTTPIKDTLDQFRKCELCLLSPLTNLPSVSSDTTAARKPCRWRDSRRPRSFHFFFSVSVRRQECAPLRKYFFSFLLHSPSRYHTSFFALLQLPNVLNLDAPPPPLPTVSSSSSSSCRAPQQATRWVCTAYLGRSFLAIKE